MRSFTQLEATANVINYVKQDEESDKVNTHKVCFNYFKVSVDFEERM